eukprot:3916326-Prorocentrum_lima.AAC.1
MATRATSPLWGVLGWPRLEDLVPPARHPDWRGRSDLLHTALMEENCPFRCRSPQALWQLIHGTPMPAAATWARLLSTDAGTSQLVQSIRAARQGGAPQ